MVKNILVFARKSIKLTILLFISILLIICAVVLFFKPIYTVSINGEQVGYSKNKTKLQKNINDYMENGDGDANLAFVQIEALPEYKLCLLKRNVVTNDDEILEKVKQSGVKYYKYYAILLGEEEKAYVADFAKAEEVVNKLKEKESTNIDQITITEIYDVELKEFTEVDTVVANLYVKKVEEPKKQVVTASSGKVNTSFNISYKKVPLGIDLIKPISGVITSRFAADSRIRSNLHTGLDIAAPRNTPIKAAASGTVTFSGTKGSYGKLIVISHGNGVETYYGHCNKLYATVGQQIKQGEVIAAVGSTGNSTGNHLHLEIRVNGVAYNPQNYLY